MSSIFCGIYKWCNLFYSFIEMCSVPSGIPCLWNKIAFDSPFLTVSILLNFCINLFFWSSLLYHYSLLNKYSGTSVYVHFGMSPTWYMSSLGVKNFVWNTTRVHQNESWHKAQTSRNSIVWNDQTVSHFWNFLRRRQKQSSLDRFLVNVKPRDPQPGPSREKRQNREY
jgi:hypothetical protein